MGVFSRFKDIVNANVNSMLDDAERPEKMVRLMIQEMEDALVEIKSACAGAMSEKHRVQRVIDEALGLARSWESRARLAVNHGRENLAREALLEKRCYQESVEELEREKAELEALVGQYKDEIRQLEDKLQTARQRQHVLVQRHIHARMKKQAQEEIRRFDSSESLLRFDQFERRMARMEEDDLEYEFDVEPSLEQKFAKMERDEALEKELAEIKAQLNG